MIKIILLDCDGPVIKREMYFTHRLISENVEINMEKVLPFFEGQFQACLIGKADLKDELAKVLPSWGYKGTVDELMDFWFRNEAELDRQMIAYIEGLKNNGVKCCLATNNEKYRVKYLWDTVGLSKYFDSCFASCELGFLKEQGEFWQGVEVLLGNVARSDVLLVDDDLSNVESAKAFGFKAEFFSDFLSIKQKIDKNLNTV